MGLLMQTTATWDGRGGDVASSLARASMLTMRVWTLEWCGAGWTTGPGVTGPGLAGPGLRSGSGVRHRAWTRSFGWLANFT